MATVRKRPSRLGQPGPDRLNVRLPDALRWRLESEARSHGHSLNNEIVKRLTESLLSRENKTELVAQGLLDNLDPAIIDTLVDLVLRARADDELADMARDWAREDQQGGEEQ